MDNQSIQQLTEGAFKYGPFFFSILFVIFLTRWTYKKYNAAITHVPVLAPNDQAVNRRMFQTTFYFGIALVVISIVWWWWFKPNTYVFRGLIRNLQQQEDIAADVYYLRRERREVLTNEDSGGILRNEHFVILRSRPFRKGEQFELDYAKNHQRRTELLITYDSDEDEPTYEVVYDESKQQNVLKRISPTSSAKRTSEARLKLEPSVLAAELQDKSPAKKAQAAPTWQVTGSDPKLIAILQDPRSEVAAKLDAIDTLKNEDTSTLVKNLKLDGSEPFSLTIFDLTQHSDPELASKATYLAKRIDLDGYLVAELSADEPPRRQSAESILQRISRPHAQAILRHVDVAKHKDLQQLSEDLAKGDTTKVLKPTASLQGDRYYVKASWNPSDSKTTSCLTQLFNKELESSRTLEQETAMMKGKSQRFVYWYSKDWALDISAQITSCGGKAEFVHPY